VVAVAVVCVVGLIAMSRARAQTPRAADPAVYTDLRNKALSVSRKALGLPASPAPVAALMDIGADGYTITTVAFEDGTASIYLSNGGGFIGGGQRHETIKNAALDMLKAAERTSKAMTPVKSHPLPDAGHTSFFVVTDSGVYSASAATKDIESGPQHPLHALYAAGQNIITQYRLTQQTK
jgi:hypothetical protein